MKGDAGAYGGSKDNDNRETVKDRMKDVTRLYVETMTKRMEEVTGRRGKDDEGAHDDL